MSASDDALLLGVIALVFGGLVVAVILFIYFEESLQEAPPIDKSKSKPLASLAPQTDPRAATSTPAESGGGAGGGKQPGSGGSPGIFSGLWHQSRGVAAERRTYTTGTRLQELLQWPALDASAALHAYLRRMDWEEKDDLFSALPQITNCVLGLDPTGGSSLSGWLNEQADLLHEPHRNLRAAQQLQASLLELLCAPGGGATPQPAADRAATGDGFAPRALASSRSSPADSRSGSLFDRLLEDAAVSNAHAMQYTFFVKHLPAHSRHAIAQNQLHLVPHLFHSKLQPSSSWQLSGPAVLEQSDQQPQFDSTQTPAPAPVLVLRAWEYFLFCFCLWPLSDGGLNALERYKTSGSHSGLLLHIGHASPATPRPLYHQLLLSYLKHFLPLPTALAKPNHTRIDTYGQLMLEALAQFWLCQNPNAQTATLLPQAFVDTSAAVLGCLDVVVRHLNAHEAERLARGLPAAGPDSAHAALHKPLYDFYLAQLDKLPEVSARVILLVRLITNALRPWHKPPPQPQRPATGGAATVGVGGARAAANGEGSVSLERSVWAPFVSASFVFYARHLFNVADELKKRRFQLTEKNDLLMLREFASWLSTPGLLPLLRKEADAAEELLRVPAYGVGASAVPSAHTSLYVQLMTLEGHNWRAACELFTPKSLYVAVDEMEKFLHKKAQELRKHEPHFPGSNLAAHMFHENAPAASQPLQVIAELREAAQLAMRALQPAGYEPTHGHSEASEGLPAVRLVDSAAQPLSKEKRQEVLTGAARCSVLRVPFRATPRQPVRPVSSTELRLLVELTEMLADRVPPRLLELGLHPRMLASHDVMAACAATVGVCAARLNVSMVSILAVVVWRLALVLCVAATGLVGRRWVLLNPPAQAASAEAWVPHIVHLLKRGVDEQRVRDSLLRLLPANARPNGTVVTVDEMLSRARQKLE